MGGRRRTWLLVLTATATIATLLTMAAIVVVAVYLSRHIDRQVAASDRAEAEFAQIRARFVREQPLVEITAGGEALVHPDRGSGGTVRNVHLLAYDPRARRLVHVNLPIWLLRLVPWTSYSLAGQTDYGVGGIPLAIEDIERHGPGLILDHQRINGAQALAWAE